MRCHEMDWLQSVVVVIVFTALSALSVAQIGRQNVVARWDFDSGDGSKDSVNANDGQLSGAPDLVDGHSGKAMRFDGQSYMQVDPEPFKFNDPDNFSLAVWVRVEKRSGWQRIYNCWRWGGYFLGEFPNNGGLELRMERNVANCDVNIQDCLLIPPDRVPLGEWVHVAFTVDWESATAILYADGEEVDDADIDGPFQYWSRLHDEATTVDTLGIGARIDSGPAEYFNGDLDELAVFSIRLTDDDIESIYSRGLDSVLAVSGEGKLATTWGEVRARGTSFHQSH